MEWFKYHTHSFISVTGNVQVMAVATQNIEKFLHCMPRGDQQNHIISISHNIQGQTSDVASYPACTDGLNETTHTIQYLYQNSETPEPIVTKFDESDYVGDMTQHAKIQTDRANSWRTCRPTSQQMGEIIINLAWFLERVNRRSDFDAV